MPSQATVISGGGSMEFSGGGGCPTQGNLSWLLVLLPQLLVAVLWGAPCDGMHYMGRYTRGPPLVAIGS